MSRIQCNEWIAKTVESVRNDHLNQKIQLQKISRALEVLFFRSVSHDECVKDLEFQLATLHNEVNTVIAENINLKRELNKHKLFIKQLDENTKICKQSLLIISRELIDIRLKIDNKTH